MSEQSPEQKRKLPPIAIVGTSPFSSPVPLEELNSYELVYPPEATTNTTTVKIFKYLGSGES